MDPKTIPGSRICFALSRDGVTAYGNNKALRSLSQWLDWLAKTDPATHNECHVSLSLESEEVILKGKRPKNVWILAEREFTPLLKSMSIKDVDGGKLRSVGFEMTFMAVTDDELDKMQKHQKSGVLPKKWVARR